MDTLTLALLRIGQATRTIALDEARSVGLTPVQAQTLLFIAHTKSFATSVGNLAAHLGATHASTVGVVDALVARGFVVRQTGVHDRRVTLLRLTAVGAEATQRLARWGHALTDALAGLAPEERTILERGLGGIIWSLRDAGHLTVAEPCRGCVHFREDTAPGATAPHYCALIRQFLDDAEAAKDCPEHTPLSPA